MGGCDAVTGVEPELAQLLARQPYTVTVDGLTLTVDRDVFPPDLGRCARSLARIAVEYRPRQALDMGTGSGYVALALSRAGVADVWAADVHEPAVRCARRNAQLNAGVGVLTIALSDLFAALPRDAMFDLVVFNQPYAPSEGGVLCGCGPDGGRELTERFLTDARGRLSREGAVLMAFSDRAPSQHDPAHVARELGWRAKTVLHAYYGRANNFVYELRPR